MVQTIKSLIAPLIMMAGLALLPACWGLKRPSPVTVTIAEICGGNPFNAACDEEYEIARIVKINECIAGDAAATLTCAGAVGANTCIRDPFVDSCATEESFSAYVARARDARATYCAADNANATLCASFAGSVQFDMACLDSPLDAPAYPTCATRPNVVRICADDPFTQTGCGNIPNIEMLRIAHCEDSATAWDDDCVEATYTGAEAARNTACLTHGINAAAGGHADCAMRENVLAACSETTPFAHDVCDAVEGIGMKQMAACLADVDADNDGGCEALIMQTCEDTPLAGVSCAGLDGHKGFLATFCAIGTNFEMEGCSMTPAAACRADPFGDMVTAGDETVDCLGDGDYDSARQARCAAGMDQGLCDTAEIAPLVCATSGANANPFATFCTGANNIGVGTIAGIRQTALDTCFNGASDGDGDICQNTIMARRMLATACVLAVAFEDRCNYTQYARVRESFCTTQSTTWNEQCDGEGISGTTNARNQACTSDAEGDADMGNDGGDTPCPERQAVINACPETDPFAATVCDLVVATTINPRRAIYCNMEINAWKNNCTKATYGVTHDPITAQGRACATYGTGAGGDDSCTTNLYAKNFCGTPGNNPLADANSGCRVLENFAEIVGVYCGANSEIPACKVDSAAWTGSFTTSLATAPATGDTANRFLSGLTGATAEPTTDFTALTTTVSDGHTANASPYLNLADTEHGFGGQADDGVMFFGGQLTDSSYRYYAGIYSSTDLGAPLTDVSQNGVWRAWIRTSGKDPDNESFMLTVDFNATTAMGTLKAFFQSTSGANTALYYDINGRFGINGVITGSVAIGTEDSDNNGSLDTEDNDYTLGRLTGLIGAQGVVAAFVSNTNTITADGNGNGTNPFVGGFVGVPTVAYDDWDVVASPDAALDNPIANQFLQYSAGGGGEGAVLVNLKDARHTDAPLGGDVADGFAYNTAGTSPDFVYYVGILPSTDLGAPLDMTTSMGTWNGSFISIEGETAATPVDFILTVTFGATVSGNAGSVAATIANTLYSFTGEFDARGVIDGTVTRTATSPVSTSTGELQGLIGAEGAVGVFITDSETTQAQHFGGGFVARKQP